MCSITDFYTISYYILVVILKETVGNRGVLARTASLNRFTNESQQNNILVPQLAGQNPNQDLHKNV